MNAKPESNLPIELLMAYADGALPKNEEARIAALVAADTRAEEIVADMQRGKRQLVDLFGGVASEPVPGRLHEAVEAGTASVQTGSVVDIRAVAAGANHRPRSSSKHLAMAASFLLVALAGGAASWIWLRSADDSHKAGFVRIADTGALATGGLRAALDDEPSSPARSAGGGPRAVLSFRAKDGGFCRQFQLAGGGGVAGVACRDDEGQWRILALAAGAGAESGKGEGAYRPAGKTVPPEIEALVDRLIDGDPFDAAHERRLIGRGWRQP